MLFVVYKDPRTVHRTNCWQPWWRMSKSKDPWPKNSLKASKQVSLLMTACKLNLHVSISSVVSDDSALFFVALPDAVLLASFSAIASCLIRRARRSRCLRSNRAVTHVVAKLTRSGRERRCGDESSKDLEDSFADVSFFDGEIFRNSFKLTVDNFLPFWFVELWLSATIFDISGALKNFCMGWIFNS